MPLDLDAACQVSIQLEWLVPQSAPGSRKRSASFKWLPGFGCTDVGGRCPRDFKRVVLYLHGGAYVLCTAKSLRGITFNVAATLQVKPSRNSLYCAVPVVLPRTRYGLPSTPMLQAALCAPDFRRPPEHPIPGPMEDDVQRVLLMHRELGRTLGESEKFQGDCTARVHACGITIATGSITFITLTSQSITKPSPHYSCLIKKPQPPCHQLHSRRRATSFFTASVNGPTP